MARHGIVTPESPIILSIENSTMCGSVALTSPNLCIGELSITSTVTHSRRLLDSIDILLKTSALELKDLDAIAVSLGPGSFTGVRIGMTTAKGLALATDKPLIGLNSLEALSYQLSTSNSLICAMLDARKNEVFSALYKKNSDGCLLAITDLLSVPVSTICNMISEKVVFVGDGSLLYKSEITNTLDSLATFAPTELFFPRASSIGILAIQKWESKDFINPGTAAPTYIRASDAEISYTKK